MMKEVAYNKAVYHIINMINTKKNEEYNESLFNLITIIVRTEIVDNLKNTSFFEYFELTYNCLHVILNQAEIREDYEVCSLIVELVANENEIMEEWIKTLPDEEKEEMTEQFENLKIAMKIMNEQNQ